MSDDTVGPAGPGPDDTPAHLSVPTTAMPAHVSVPTTAAPVHSAIATTAVPAHSHDATTMAPAHGGPAPAAAPRSRQASYDAGETIAVGRHRLVVERLLFVGGQAELYLVKGGPAPVAVLKLYSHGARPKADVLERWKLLPPTAVIALLDADPSAEPRAWELLAYAEGGTLAGSPDAPAGPVRDPARLRLITLQAADALHVLHTVGSAVHRDVSPDNFLWLDAARTRLVLSDLGSSSIMSDGAARSVTIRGKLPFMAPEELLPMGDGVVVGEAADFYALGIMVLTLWAGHHPFVGREADQIALKSRGAVPMPDDLPPDFRSLVEALLLPANIRLTYEGIQRWAAGQPIPRATTTRQVSYPRLTVRPAQGAPYDVETPAALARFLRDEPVAGERFLYAWNMREWASSDAGLVADLTDIVEKEFPKNRAAGRQKAAYLLDSALPFAAPDGTECRDYAELSAWLEADPARPKGLSDPAHPLWLYLATRPENELREAMAEIHADVREGKPEATALIRHYLMQFATAGSWRAGDGTVVTDLDAFLAGLPTHANAWFKQLMDPADPLLLWLETQRPGTAVRGGRLRALEASVIKTLAGIDWIAIVLNKVPAVLMPPLSEQDDSWREAMWPPKLAVSNDLIALFLDGWWRVVEDARFGWAAMAWLVGEPETGARHQVAIALLSGHWEVTGQPLSRAMAAAFAALPAHTGSAEDAEVIDAAAKAFSDRLAAIRTSAPKEQAAQVQLDAATAFAVAAGRARATAPGWWDALLAKIGDVLGNCVHIGFALNRSAPNVLAEVLARRGELRRALAEFRLPAHARWQAEDARAEALTRELVAAEAKSRDARLKAISDKAVSLRGTPHVQTLSDLDKGLPHQEKRWIARANLLFYWVAGIGILSALPLPSTGEPEAMTGGIAAVLTAVVVWRATRRKLLTVAGLIFGPAILIGTLPLFQAPRVRLLIGLVVSVALALALWIRRRHVRRVVLKAELERQEMPPDLAQSVRKACAEAERHARASLAERWLMMHAVIAMAKDPASVKLEEVPGETAAATA
ncbi:MAG: protein kinase [Gemmatimonadales bacterium]